MEPDNDQQLIARMLTGEQRAFDDFFNAYADRLFRFALPRVNEDAALAEDVVQQTLCRAIDKLNQFRGEAALFTWLCRICRNTIVDGFRAKDRPRGVALPLDDSDEVRLALESIAALPGTDPADIALSDELTGIVRTVLDYLPRQYGNILEWKYIHGESVREIADRLGTTSKAVESALNRARIAFREGIEAVANTDVMRERLGVSG